MTASDWFHVDKDGLAALIERKGKAFVVAELLQNAWDEAGVTEVHADLTSSGRGKANLAVADDAPDGFADLAHAYTLFAPSAKVDNAEQRGRFNLGEKLVLALCDEATIVSTRGGVSFSDEGRKALRRKRETGSEFIAIIRMNQAEVAEAARFVHTLIPPAGIATTFNGEKIANRTPVHTFTVSLKTELANDEGKLTSTTRKTLVSLYEPMGDEVPHIYEMGIPVVELDGPWHADIGQKVPLNFERDNVTPAYLRSLRVAILNENFDRISPDDATDTWVSDALNDPRTSDEAVRQVLTHKFGDKAVRFDPSDRQANEEAILQGYNVVHGRSLNKEQWANANRAEALPRAGAVTPSNSTIDVRYGADSEDSDRIAADKWTPGMKRMADYAQRLSHELLGFTVQVEMYRSAEYFLAAYGRDRRVLMFNLQRLGHTWFDAPDQHRTDALLLHEFAHHVEGNHLSEGFHDAICKLGASMRTATSTLTNGEP